jgi:hypothetical protein
MSLFSNFMQADRKVKRKFLLNMVWKGFMGFRKFKKRKERGELFPAFQFISVTNDCNLRCQGCWVATSGIKEHLDVAKIHQIIEESKKQGSYFFGILGGEPLIYKQRVAGSNPAVPTELKHRLSEEYRRLKPEVFLFLLPIGCQMLLKFAYI